MKSLAITVAIIIAALGLYQYLRRASELQQLELVDRCQQMGTRFANDIRTSDREFGIPVENRDFTYRVHYNTVERKCLVLTEGAMTLPLGIGRALMSQIWDVNRGVGAGVQALAEKDVPMSAQGGLKFYRDRKELPLSPTTVEWFENLMIR